MGRNIERFRTALLAAMGLVPFAGCGGAVDSGGAAGEGGAATTGGGDSGGAPTMGGAHTMGGFQTAGGRPAMGGAITGGAVGSGGQTVTLGGASPNGGGGARGIPCTGESDADPTGSFKVCDGGWKHRVRITQCEDRLTPDGGVPPNPINTNDCQSNGDCNERAYGFCTWPQFPGPAGNVCSYGCVADADCPSGSICECGELIGICVQSNCREDADCGAGWLCSSYNHMPGCFSPAYTCQLPGDTCATDGDCQAPLLCTATPQGRNCHPIGCVPGRPFLVRGEARVAEVEMGDGWASAHPLGHELPDALRSRAAEAWTRVAQMEHASIAAFARFTLELLSFGAPRDLVQRSAQAMADEARHAADAFTLASGYSGTSLAPAALDLAQALVAPDLSESVLTAFIEGCVGETVAALTAAESLRCSSVESVRSVLTRVADEELRHAELAWCFVQWSLPRVPRSVQQKLVRALARELALCEEQPPSGVSPESALLDAELLAHGVLSEARARKLRIAALREIVSPCLSSLLETHRRAHGESEPSGVSFSSASFS